MVRGSASVLGFFALLGLGDMRDEDSPASLSPLDDQFARAVDSVALEAVQADKLLGDGHISPSASLADIRLAIEHVEHFGGGLNPARLPTSKSLKS